MEIAPVEFQKGAIYKALHLKNPERITPHIHFPLLIEMIRQKAVQLEGPYVDTPDEP